MLKHFSVFFVVSEGHKTDLLCGLTGAKDRRMIPSILLATSIDKKRCYFETVVLIMGIIVKSERVTFHLCAPCHNIKK